MPGGCASASTKGVPCTAVAAGVAVMVSVVLAVIEPGKLKDYELKPDAAGTVLLYSRRVVRVNHAFRAGELTDKAVRAVADDVKTHFTGK